MSCNIAITEELIREFEKIKPMEIKSIKDMTTILLERYSNVDMNEEPALTDEEILSNARKEIIFQKNKFMECANEVIKRKFIIDSDNRQIVANLFDYFTSSESNLDTTKGILLHGEKGVGKTDLLASFQRYLSSINNKNSFILATAREIKLSCITDPKEIKRYISINNLCIDDIGTEGAKNKIMGNEMNVINDILAERYRFRHLLNYTTHGTTNFTNKQLKEFYDSRVIDRFSEMFNIIPMNGKNRRI